MKQSPIVLTRLRGAVVALAIVYIICLRLRVAADAPLWLDETWSAMIATRPNWAAFWHEAWLDCNPPLYYIFLRGWVSIAGDSNLMLRLPSIAFVLAAAALPLIWRPQALPSAAAAVWAGLIMLWPHGLALMLDARGYGLMLLLSTASTLVLCRMMQDLGVKLAAAWVALGTAMFLTHYFSAVLVLAQALVLVRRHGWGVFKLWPSALLALPALAWFAYHLPRLEAYAHPDVVWQQTTSIDMVLDHAQYVMGSVSPVLSGVMLTIVAAAVVYRGRSGVDQAAMTRDLVAVASTAAIGFGFAVLVGVMQASLVNRYLVPLVPPALLGLTFIFLSSARPKLYALMALALFLPLALNARQANTAAEMRAVYGIERASNFVAQSGADQVLFLWDHPAGKILDRASLEQIGSYFLKRQGIGIPVRTVIVPASADANVVLRNASQGTRPAVIWLYNRADQTSARKHPPAFANDPAWTCRTGEMERTVGLQLGAIACVKLEKDGD